jgi:hypothetical protein
MRCVFVKHSKYKLGLLIAAGLLITSHQLAFAGSWKEVSELSQNAFELTRAGKIDDAARSVITATRMRQSLPPNKPSGDRSNTDGFASMQLESAFIEVSNRYAEKNRWADVISFCRWHITDSNHLNTLGFVTAYTTMGDAYRALNDLGGAEKCYKVAMTAYDRGTSAMTAAEIAQCKKLFLGYARVLKLQNKAAEAQAISDKIAR